MSAAKFGQPVYKVYEPGYHPQRTIILDEQIESPETLTIRLEEEAAQNGGDLGGGCPPGLLPMSAYKAQPPQLHGYADSPYSQYSTQSFSTQQTENAASHLNQMAFAANSAVSSQYLSTSTTPGIDINVVSCQPTSGSYGTKVSLKVTSLSPPPTFIVILFGSHRSSGHASKDSRDSSGVYSYTIIADVPQFSSTSCSSPSSVPLTLIVQNESGNGEEIARVENIGVFSYQDSKHGGSAGGSGAEAGVSGDSPHESPTALGRSPVHHRASPPHQNSDGQIKIDSLTTQHHSLHADSTNTYGFPPNVPAASASTQPDFSAASTASYSQGNSSMLSSYRTASYTDHYTRAPPILRSPHSAGGWSFGGVDAMRNPVTSLSQTGHSLSRSALGAIHNVGASTPTLQRSSLIPQTSAGGYPAYGSGILEKAVLNLMGDLNSMDKNWTPEEWSKKRRLVMFNKRQKGNVTSVSFRPIPEQEYRQNSICVSCIWWEEKGDCFVTSVDTIALLEQLLVAPSKFPVDEKNRIRRNLEHYRPCTVSKAKHESEKFFGVIMGFGNPKPRNIEKDIKVFKWSDLSAALTKIFGKYSASSVGMAGGPNSSPRMRMSAAASLSSPPYPSLPGAASSLGVDSLTLANYAGNGHHHDSLTSPRTLTGGASTWPSYGSTAKAMSPSLKNESPGPSSTTGLRISTLPAVYDHRNTAASLSSPFALGGPAQHSPHHGQGGYGHSGIPVSQSSSRAWDSYAGADNYAPPSSSYGGGAYGERS
ncbi:hypothetical protein QBC35DRAFT_381590 [Podospora australis]|uniref:DUF7082 domain-containing protein n=1 Tax=Podospora australis TaxID=1536484 RepID=A0AAN6WVC1_9PEZI|nr:hypothetical protein QBC35DRAFT_381590 [Podospora australis]